MFKFNFGGVTKSHFTSLKFCRLGCLQMLCLFFQPIACYSYNTFSGGSGILWKRFTLLAVAAWQLKKKKKNAGGERVKITFFNAYYT